LDPLAPHVLSFSHKLDIVFTNPKLNSELPAQTRKSLFAVDHHQRQHRRRRRRHVSILVSILSIRSGRFFLDLLVLCLDFRRLLVLFGVVSIPIMYPIFLYTFLFPYLSRFLGEYKLLFVSWVSCSTIFVLACITVFFLSFICFVLAMSFLYQPASRSDRRHIDCLLDRLPASYQMLPVAISRFVFACICNRNGIRIRIRICNCFFSALT